MSNVILYVRRSLDSDPPAAERLAELRAWAESNGNFIAGEFIDDATENGRVIAPAPKRDNALYALMNGGADLLAVPELRALARSPSDLRQRLSELDAAGAGLYVHALGLNTRTPEGATFRRVLDALLDFHREARVEVAKRIHGRARKLGVRVGGRKIAPSMEAQVQSLLLSNVVPKRIRQLTHCGSGTVIRVRKYLVEAGLMRCLPGTNKYVAVKQPAPAVPIPAETEGAP